MIEKWRTVPGCDERYEVSDLGRVRSKNVRFGGRTLKPFSDKDGYLQVVISSVNGPQIKKKVHRLVAEAFFGPSTQEVNHKSGDKKDNNCGNLEYCTRAENRIHARDILGKMANRKLTDEQVRKIRSEYIYRKVPLRFFAEKYDVGTSAIYRVVRGISNLHVK